MSKIEIYKSRPTTEGAGVKLNRAFGLGEAPALDPFLLLDDFHSDNPDDYSAGFPWHPHRGMETVTYMVHGNVRHEDSMGNNGVIGPGDVQWMTAGSGIIHSEMPEQEAGLMRGLQLWVNLPGKNKMMPPRYQEIKSKDIPEVSLEDGYDIAGISGAYSTETVQVTEDGWIKITDAFGVTIAAREVPAQTVTFYDTEAQKIAEVTVRYDQISGIIQFIYLQTDIFLFWR